MRRILILVGLLGTLSACAEVRPWQREDLARPSMISDRTAGEARFDDHSRSAREGAEGGSGQAGGGCGCN